MKHARLALAVAGALMTTLPAVADEWPSRPVRMVNSFAAGGTADVLTRVAADHLSAVFKQQFFVETRAGAGGVIAVKSVADSPPDGYNFVTTNASLLVLHPIGNPKLTYDPKRDLTNIAMIAGSPRGLMGALLKLDAYSQRIPLQNPNPAQNSMFIVEPLTGGSSILNLFASHPPTEARVEALRKLEAEMKGVAPQYGLA